MTRLFLAAGVAALAIAMPASAKPGGGQGDGDKQKQSASQTRGGGQGGNVQARGGGGGKADRAQSRRDRGGGQAIRMQGRSNGGAQARSFERRGGSSTRNVERRSFASQDRARGGSSVRMERQNNKAARANFGDRRENRGSVKAQRFEQRQVRGVERQQRFEQRQVRGVERQQRFEQRQARNVERQAVRGTFERIQNRQNARSELRDRRFDVVRNRDAFRNELRTNRIERLESGAFIRDARFGPRTLRVEDFGDRARGWGVGGCPPGLASKGCMPPGQAAKLLGTSLSTATRFASFSDVPYSVRYLYPDTDDYYYRFGDGYAYRVDRDDSLISALLPLAFGGYMPGSYLPNSYMSSPSYYMNSYAPSAFGFNSFYPDSQYDCNRYANGVIYQVDCASGFVEDVIPLYAGGYGVGQYLPTGSGYYNLPYQYRDMYYDTSDYGYWYSPGAIYQYDPSSSMITSVAALLSPGFGIGQQMPYGYDAYNVPYAYRSTYYDTPDAMYRYNNGNIYQVDPTTMLVTAIVASILT